jgi:hypothetical protein
MRNGCANVTTTDVSRAAAASVTLPVCVARGSVSSTGCGSSGSGIDCSQLDPQSVYFINRVKDKFSEINCTPRRCSKIVITVAS